jgi:Uma2 family endonuclease
MGGDGGHPWVETVNAGEEGAMTILTEKRHYTPEDLLAMPNGEQYELVDGELVEKDMGAKARWIASRLYHAVELFIDQEHVGWAFAAEIGYQCFEEDPNRVRRPDVSFICAGCLPGEEIPRGHIRTVPELVAEVVSPDDLYRGVLRKVGEYLRAGVPLVWVIEPETGTVDVWRRDRSGVMLQGADELDGKEVLPGFRCPLEGIFPPRPEETGGGEGEPEDGS